jgi:phage tail-like protein
VARRDDWLLAQLPVGMVEDDFFVRFVSIFQEVATTMLDGVDNLDNILDLRVAPEPMVRWLASWIGVDSVDASLPHTLQRRIVQVSASMLAWRGTRHGLRQFLELMSGGPVELSDSGGVFAEGGAPDGPSWLRMRVTSTGWLPEADFVALVRDEVPAHVTAELWVGDRQVLPPPVVPEPRSSVQVMSSPTASGPASDAAGESSAVEPLKIPNARSAADDDTAAPHVEPGNSEEVD